MFYEKVENLKARLFFLKHKNDQFVPAGAEPIQDPGSTFSTSNSNTSSGFSFSSLKNLNLKELDFATRRLLVLVFVLIVSSGAMWYLSARYSSFKTERAAARALEEKKRKENGGEDAWNLFVKSRRKALASASSSSISSDSAFNIPDSEPAASSASPRTN